MKRSAPNETPYIKSSFPTWLSKHLARNGEGDYRSPREDYSELVSSKHDTVTVALVNTLQMCLPAHNQASQPPSRNGGGACKTAFPAEEL